MDAMHKQALRYIFNTGGEPMIEWFDEDHAPIGPELRSELKRERVLLKSETVV